VVMEQTHSKTSSVLSLLPRFRIDPSNFFQIISESKRADMPSTTAGYTFPCRSYPSRRLQHSLSVNTNHRQKTVPIIAYVFRRIVTWRLKILHRTRYLTKRRLSLICLKRARKIHGIQAKSTRQIQESSTHRRTRFESFLSLLTLRIAATYLSPQTIARSLLRQNTTTPTLTIGFSKASMDSIPTLMKKSIIVRGRQLVDPQRGVTFVAKSLLASELMYDMTGYTVD
jgi:hypothetical protein